MAFVRQDSAAFLLSAQLSLILCAWRDLVKPNSCRNRPASAKRSRARDRFGCSRSNWPTQAQSRPALVVCACVPDVHRTSIERVVHGRPDASIKGVVHGWAELRLSELGHGKRDPPDRVGSWNIDHMVKLMTRESGTASESERSSDPTPDDRTSCRLRMPPIIGVLVGGIWGLISAVRAVGATFGHLRISPASPHKTHRPAFVRQPSWHLILCHHRPLQGRRRHRSSSVVVASSFNLLSLFQVCDFARVVGAWRVHRLRQGLQTVEPEALPKCYESAAALSNLAEVRPGQRSGEHSGLTWAHMARACVHAVLPEAHVFPEIPIRGASPRTPRLGVNSGSLLLVASRHAGVSYLILRLLRDSSSDFRCKPNDDSHESWGVA